MDLGQSIILGIIQGLAEFLPISSSGHLVIVNHLLGIESMDVFFNHLQLYVTSTPSPNTLLVGS